MGPGQDCAGLVRVLLGQDEFDEDPRDDAPVQLRDKLVRASAHPSVPGCMLEVKVESGRCQDACWRLCGLDSRV